jgi:GNAT superfamily N-acetyltransferase
MVNGGRPNHARQPPWSNWGCTAAWEDQEMVTLRPMTEGDVPAAVVAFDSGFLAMRARFGLPITGNSLQDERRRQERTRHFQSTDPGGSWVADDEGVIVGMSQSFVREDYWMLSQLGAVPGRQGHGLGRELLRLALSHGDPGSPGTIQCSRDPKAMALYTSFGFSLHPVVAAWGTIRPGSVQRPDDVTRLEPEQVTEAELAIVTAIDRKVRGSARTVDIESMLNQPGNRLLLHGDQGYAVAKDERIVTLGARSEESATRVLRTMLAEAPVGETIEVNWLTSAQQWAIRVLTQAGVELQPYGPVMVRGMDAPPSPYIPSGGYG